MKEKVFSVREVVGGGYADFWNSKKRYVVCKGSRASKKSTTAALKIIVRMMQYPLANTLVVRKTGASLKDSCFAQLRWAIERLGVSPWWQARVSPLELEYTPTEREANRRVKFTERALSIARDTRELRRVMKNIKTAIGTLDDESKRLIVMHYIDGRTWMEVADALACSESGARQKGYRAVSKIAAILFGSKINQYTQVVLIA